VPGTPYLAVTGCPPLPPFGTMPPISCTDTGDGVVTHALARTNQALWLVYLWRHVDIDLLQHCFPFENTSACVEDTKADRSTAEIVVRRLPLDGLSPPSEVAWRLPTTAAEYQYSFAVDSQRDRLLITTAPPGPRMSGAIRFVMLDEGQLLAPP